MPQVKRANGNAALTLNIKYNTTASEAKKEYFRLSRLLHPDKTQAPGAEEAMQVCGKWLLLACFHADCVSDDVVCYDRAWSLLASVGVSGCLLRVCGGDCNCSAHPLTLPWRPAAAAERCL